MAYTACGDDRTVYFRDVFESFPNRNPREFLRANRWNSKGKSLARDKRFEQSRRTNVVQERDEKGDQEISDGRETTRTLKISVLADTMH